MSYFKYIFSVFLTEYQKRTQYFFIGFFFTKTTGKNVIKRYELTFVNLKFRN